MYGDRKLSIAVGALGNGTGVMDVGILDLLNDWVYLRKRPVDVEACREVER